MRSIYSKIGVASLLASATYAADSTPVTVDLDGFDAAMIAIEVGVGGITFSTSNKIEFVLTHSDDDSTYVNVTDADMQGVTGITNGIIKSLIAAHAAADVSVFGYIGEKRYLRILADFSGTHGTGTPLSALVLKGEAHLEPVNP